MNNNLIIAQLVSPSPRCNTTKTVPNHAYQLDRELFYGGVGIGKGGTREFYLLERAQQFRK